MMPTLKGPPISARSLARKSAKKKEQRHRREAAARQSQVKMCTLTFLSPSLHIAYLILYFCSQSSTPSTPSSSFASPATSAPRTTEPVRVAGFDALLKTAGGDDEEDADFSHPLGSAAAAPAAPSLKRRRDSPPGFYVWPDNQSDGISDDDLSSAPTAMVTHIASHFLMGAAVPSVPRVAASMTTQVCLSRLQAPSLCCFLS